MASAFELRESVRTAVHENGHERLTAERGPREGNLKLSETVNKGAHPYQTDVLSVFV